MKLFLFVLGTVFTTAIIHGQSTSLTEPLVENEEMTIVCELTEAPRPREIPVIDSAKSAAETKGTYSYRLWLPEGYLADGKKQWPCMFIMSPGGNAKMGSMAETLKKKGFVVVMLVEAKNGPWEPIVGNFLAAHDDVVKRVRVAEGRKYATGMSGGARGSSIFVQARPGFGGLILQAAGPADDSHGVYQISGIKRNPKLSVAMTMGRDDRNAGEAGKMKGALPASRFRVFEFDGGHSWAPPEVFEQALDWVLEKSAKS